MDLPTTSAFSQAQISQYLQRINFPERLLSQPRDIAFLRTLHKHHITSIPYENMAVHYSSHKQVPIDPISIFNKVVSPAGRGGYCLELSVLYLHLLLGLGFNVYPSIARIRLRTGPTPHGLFMGNIHLTLIVTLDDSSRWSCDVGFGGDAPTGPLPLISGESRPNIGEQRGRLVQVTFDSRFESGYAPDHHEGEVATTADPPAGPAVSTGEREVAGLLIPPSLEGRKAWIYQYANPGQEWASYYAFSGEPAQISDLITMNEWTSKDAGSFQRMVLLAVKFLLAEGQGDTEPFVAGKVMLIGDTVKRNMGGKTELVQVCKTESERVEALKAWFGIELTEEQAQGIRGFGTEIKAQ